MWHDWRAPACYLSVGFLCMVYVWIMPLTGLTDIAAGAGLGAAVMWALNDWEARQRRRRRSRKASLRSVILSRVAAVSRAARGLEPVPTTSSARDAEELHQLARVMGAIEESMAAPASVRPHPAGPPRHSLKSLKDQVPARDIGTIDERLRARGRTIDTALDAHQAGTRARARASG